MLATLAAFCVAAAVSSGRAAVVTNANDSGAGSLREAIASAPSGETITFAAGLAGQTITLSTVGDTVYGPSALLINKTITIIGPSGNSGIAIARGAAAQEMRLFYVNASGNLTLRNLTFANGLARGGNGQSADGGGGGGGGGLGGAIFNEGALRIETSTLTGNSAIGGNGGTGGTATGSTAGGNGGAPNAGAAGSFFPGYGANGGFGGGGGGGGASPDIGYFDGNYAGAGGVGGGGGGGGAQGSNGAGGGGGFAPITGARGGSNRGGGGGGLGLGGAIANKSGTVALVNCTVSGNTVGGGAGGTSQSGGSNGANGVGVGSAVFNYNGTFTATNSTLAGSAGIYTVVDGGNPSVSLTNTILDEIGYQIFGGNGTYSTSGSNNLIRSNGGFSGGVVSSADPLLGPLQNNGGPTSTHSIPLNSPAVDTGADAVTASLTTDQRGNARQSRGRVDIGAFELQNRLPVAAAQSGVAANQGQAITITLSATDPDGDSVTYSIVSQPTKGTLSAISGNQASYTGTSPGADSFSFRATDAYGANSNTAAVSLTVNAAPVASDQSVATNQETAKVITLAATDAEGDALTYSIVTSPARGSLGAISGNQVTYTPTAGYFGSDSFTFRATDSKGALSNTATVTVTVNGIPVASPQTVNSNQGEMAVPIYLSGSDPENGGLTYEIVSAPAQGSLNQESGNHFTYLPSSSTYYGSDSFTFRVVDSQGAKSNTATVTIAINGAPQAANQSVALKQASSRTITLSATDPEGDVIAYSVVANPARGTLGAVGGNQVTYTPEVTYFGTDSFTFRATDAKGAVSKTATVSIDVVGASGLSVTTAADTVADDGVTSLREAIQTANFLADPSGSVITFASALTGQTIALSQIGNGTVGRSALIVTAKVLIVGPSGNSGVTIARDAAAPAMRLFYVQSGGELTLRNLSLGNGLARGGSGGSGESAGGGGAGLGGMLFNDGAVQIVGCTLTGNVAQGGNSSTAYNSNSRQGGSGGGLGNVSVPGNGGDAQYNDSSQVPGGANGGGNGGVFLTPGNAGGFGGGGGGGGSIPGLADGRGGPGGFGGGGSGERNGGGTAPFGGFGGGNGGTSDFGFNARGGGGGGGGLGGAVFNRGTLALTNSTLSGNTAQGGTGGLGNDGRGQGATGKGFGGALFNYNGSVTVVNSTLASNVAAEGGGGIYNLGDGATATVVALNTIVAQTPGGALDFVGNAINNGTSTTSGNNDVIQKQVGFAGTLSSSADPQLGGLSNNGGPTKTMALLGGSPALDGGDDAVLNAPYSLGTDQRGPGSNRIRGPHVDVGALEVQTEVFPVVTDLSVSTPEENPRTITLVGSISDGSSLAYEIVTRPVHGTLSAVDGDQVTYTPVKDFNGSDSFTYRAASAAGGGSNIATVSITVTPVNDAPVALGAGLRDDFNDNSLDAAKWQTALPFSGSGVTEENGRITLTMRGYLSTEKEFKPAAAVPLRVTGQFNLADPGNFMQILTRCDGFPVASAYGETRNGIEFAANSASKQLSIIRRVNGSATTLATVAMPLAVNTAYNFAIQDNGSAVSLTVTDAADATKTAIITATDSTTFGVNRVTFHNRESSSDVSYLDNVIITGGPLAATINTALSGQLSATDVDGDRLSYTRVANPAHGSVTVDVNGEFTYTPANGYAGDDSFSFKANDGALDSDVITVSIAIAEARSLVVTTLADASSSADGATTLREAIAYASTLPGSPTITFVGGLNGTSTLSSTLNIAHDMTITGPGANVLAISGGNAVRVFNVTSGTVSISNLSIVNGRLNGGYSGTNPWGAANGGSAQGGGIYNSATLSLVNCQLSGHQALGGAGAQGPYYMGGGNAGNGGHGLGGAVYNNGTVALTNCTLNNNTAAGGAGGFSNSIVYSGPPNAGSGGSGQGGGVYNLGTVSFVNCTVSGNNSTAGSGGGGNPPGYNGSSHGGGIFNAGTSTVRHSTLSGNASQNAGGIYTSGSLTIAHTILNAGTLGPNLGVGGGTVTDQGYNLSSDNASTSLNQAGDQNSVNPKLDTLKYNGGPTQTHTLLNASPAIDAGNANFTAPPNTDQRGPGFLRVTGGRIEIGAFEIQAANRPPVASDQSVSVFENNPRTITLAASDPDGQLLSYAIVTPPQHGTLSSSTGNPVTYTPAAGYFGSDSFTFKANDSLNDSNTATVAITVVETKAVGVTIDQASGQTDPTRNGPINFTVVFSEPVTGFTGTDVTLGGTAGANLATVTGSEASYNVAVSGMSTSGTVIASIPANVVVGAANNANTASTSTDNTVSYDMAGPTVTIEQAAGQSDPTNNGTIHFHRPVLRAGPELHDWRRDAERHGGRHECDRHRLGHDIRCGRQRHKRRWIGRHEHCGECRHRRSRQLERCFHLRGQQRHL